jgi:hypothetical protein
MLLDNSVQGPFVDNKNRRVAAELLVHILQFQNVESNIGKDTGKAAGDWCADFIEQFAKRLDAMK